MNIGIAHAVSVIGIEGHIVRIEAALLNGLPSFTIVGLPDTAVSESRERIRAAFAAAGIHFPSTRLTVNLSPADTPKSGTGFDVGIAAAILGAMSSLALPARMALLGELGLDGSVRAVKGTLPAALACAREDMSLVVPHGARVEAELAHIEVREVWHIGQLAHWLGIECAPIPPPQRPAPHRISGTALPEQLDLADIRGQEEARMALEVAAAGSHHLLMTGSPGVGKSMLARRVPGILPELSVPQAVEVATIASALGEFEGELSTVPPLSQPHHNVSTSALVGGGSWPRPGAISRAHRGVLFLDELPEFSARALQALRQPLEERKVEIHRAKAVVVFPAHFQLIAASNPCRCGKYLDNPAACTCSSRERRDYIRRIGGPLLDRFDLNIILHRLTKYELAHAQPAETSIAVAGRVREARERQRRRYADEHWETNSEAPGGWIRRHVELDSRMAHELDKALSEGSVSMRGVDKILRLALTIADLDGADQPHADHFYQAFAYRVTGGFYGGR